MNFLYAAVVTATMWAGPEGPPPRAGLAIATVATASGEFRPVLVQVATAPPRRPMILPALYVGLGAAQAMDLYSTRTALKSGAREANPLIGPIAGNVAGMAVVKAASTAGIIYFSEKLWKKSRGAALVTMIAANVVTGYVAAHNLRIAQGRR